MYPIISHALYLDFDGEKSKTADPKIVKIIPP